jgi:hypothetical protein
MILLLFETAVTCDYKKTVVHIWKGAYHGIDAVTKIITYASSKVLTFQLSVQVTTSLDCGSLISQRRNYEL